MIYADCNSLLFCINKYYHNEIEIQNKEIVRCINTISYVIRHMYDELNNLCLYCKKCDHDKHHFIKTSNKKVTISLYLWSVSTFTFLYLLLLPKQQGL